MTAAPNANAYLRTKVLTASPAELRLMLFDGAIRFAEQAKTGLEQKDYEATYVGITRCQSILLELVNSLQPEHDPELCGRLSGLYTYMYTRLMSASTEKSPQLVAEVLTLLRYERETWSLLLDQLAAENKSARTIHGTPDAEPPVPADSNSTARTLIGGTVSFKA